MFAVLFRNVLISWQIIEQRALDFVTLIMYGILPRDEGKY
jgi:hypothetical protein